MATEKPISRPSPAKKGPKKKRHKTRRQRQDDGGARGSQQNSECHQGPATLVPSQAIVPQPITTVKHKVVFELIECKDKKKRLKFTTIKNRQPPLGYAFVACGNLELTTACKELARERGELMFIVAPPSPVFTSAGNSRLNEQINRVGYHFPVSTVQDARAKISQSRAPEAVVNPVHSAQGLVVDAAQGQGLLVLVPVAGDSKAYLDQVESTFRELFPQMPKKDREAIIGNAFQLGTTRRTSAKPVGLQFDVPLTHRVHLATVAHVRHQYTEYDELMRRRCEKHFARAAVRTKCIDMLVKWRGDDESGRDQLEEILREVIIIADTDEEDDESGSLDDDGCVDHQGFLIDSVDTLDARGCLLERKVATPETRGPLMEPQAWEDEVPCPRLHGLEKHYRRGFKRYHAYEEAFRHGDEADTADHLLAPSGNTRGQSVASRLPSDRAAVTAFGSAGNAPSANGFVRQTPSQSLRASGAMMAPSIEAPDASMPATAHILRGHPVYYGRTAPFAEIGAFSKSHVLPNRQVTSVSCHVPWHQAQALSNIDRIPVGQDQGVPRAEPDRYPYANESMELEVNGFVEIPRPANISFHASAHRSEAPRTDVGFALPRPVMRRDGHGLTSPPGAYGASHHQSYWQALFNGETPPYAPEK